MEKGKVISLEERIPKLKEQRRKKTNRRLILLISLFFSLILSIVYFQSPLSHVKSISVKGNSAISENEIVQASQLAVGMNLWDIDKDEVQQRIEALAEVKKASVQVSFFRTVTITIEEHRKIAYIVKGKSFYPVLENGTVIQNQPSSSLPVYAPLLLNFKEGAVLNEMIDQLEQLPSEIIHSISEIYYEPKESDKHHITLYMNDGFEVSATIRTFAQKMIYYPSIVNQIDPNVKGIIDLEVGSFFRAYETEGEVDDEEGESEG
ncbi:cell division protein FtsQ/DivIB [Aeribacillus pallidus]|uniref:cell division protein FtsQ/DivIB n=1 Tax=Aeribacillus pallidus TaxID=33936 RepID=UPI001DF232B3|nr:FtsQ-type POTRA domain-containing protein [Bacillus sp. (in: firmicutes)]